MRILILMLKRVSVLLFCVLVCVFISACNSSEQNVSQGEDVIVKEVKGVKGESKPDKNKLSLLLLGTGGVQGVYFPIGGVICRLLNRHKERNRIRCTLESTAGSIYNLRELRAGAFDLVVAQSDWQYHAYHGSSTFEKAGPNKDLRAVFALEADPLAIMVRKQSDIQSFDDLQSRVVSFGYTRSLQHRIVDDLLQTKQWTLKQFKEVKRLSDSKQVQHLCDQQVEAIGLMSSSLPHYLQQVPTDCEYRFVPINESDAKAMITAKPYYRTGNIPADLYLEGQNPVLSVGLGATFVASLSTSPKAIYHVVKEIAENFKDFQSLHPSLAHLKKSELPYAGISAPLHPGAIRYYREAGLLKH